MIKPRDVDLSRVEINRKRVADLEASFDEAILRARDSGRWPARIPNALHGCTEAEIEHVADRYRAERWLVMTGQTSELALIYHPDRKRNGRR